METVKSEQLKKFEEELEQTRKEIREINSEKARQIKLYNQTLDYKEKCLKDIQSVIDLINVGTLESAQPKYFKIKVKNRNVTAEVYKTRKIIPEREMFTLVVDGIFCTREDASDSLRVQFTTNNAIVLGYNLEEALNYISSHFEEITEEEYNEAKKMACEAIVNRP